MTTLREAAQQALEALKSVQDHRPNDETNAAVTALRDALAQQEQEPVAFADRISFDQAMKSGKGHDVWPEAGDYEARTGRKLRVLYTHPPHREWQSLSEEEIRAAYGKDLKYRDGDYERFARAIEAALKERNNG